MKTVISSRCLLVAITLAFSAMGRADTPAPAASGVWNAAFRYRFESVNDDAFARDANANTARLRLGWRHTFGEGFSVLLEGEGVAELNDAFNSTANRQSTYPIVADARAFELNQAALGWQSTSTHLLLGRQHILLDNQRFVGNVGWRQNEQTFDALSVDHKFQDAWTLRYSYLDRVHRVNGDEAIDPLARERDLSTHLLNSAYSYAGGAITAYGYFLEDRDVAAASTRTIGLRWTGTQGPPECLWGWTAEFAQQSEYRNNAANFSHNYLLLEPSLSHSGVAWRLGYERLAGNGSHAFQTPLATLHAFNGWADKFLVTPALGLEDRYLGAGGKFGTGRWQDQLNWGLSYHDFRADQSSVDFGSELDASLGATLGHGWSALLKLADYRADNFARDTRKVWLQLEWVL